MGAEVNGREEGQGSGLDAKSDKIGSPAVFNLIFNLIFNFQFSIFSFQFSMCERQH